MMEIIEVMKLENIIYKLSCKIGLNPDEELIVNRILSGKDKYFGD